MYEIKKWTPDLKLKRFYKEAKRRGFKNNSSQKDLVEAFYNEKEWCVWILYYNNEPVGSVAAHSFDDLMGPNTYRIAARTCVFTDKLPLHSLRTRNQIVTHQHATSQFLIPTCLRWLPENSRAFITSNEKETGTQRLVHKIYFPAMEKKGLVSRIDDFYYRWTIQTVWEIHKDKFLQDLEQYPKWG